MISWDGLASWYRFPDHDHLQPEKMVLATEATQELQHLLKLLPPDYRVVVILKYWYTMSYQEIAETLDSTVSAVKSRLFRARKMMAGTVIPEFKANLGGTQSVFC